VLPRQVGEDGIDMRRVYATDRGVFCSVFLVYMLANWTLAFTLGTPLWSAVTLQRAVVTVLIASLLVLNRRGWDWFVTSAVLATAIVRTATQAVR
jgi:hypothetical protein